MTVLHRHHILPRHAGGTDHPSNLIYLTVEEHAEAHLKLYLEHGREMDRIAWLSLSKQIDCAEAQRLASIARNTGVPKSAEHRLKLSLARKGKKLPPWVGQKSGESRRGRKASPEHRAAISAGQRGKKIPPSSVRLQAINRQKTDGTQFTYDGVRYGSFSEAATALMGIWGVSKEAARGRIRKLAARGTTTDSDAPALLYGRAA